MFENPIAALIFIVSAFLFNRMFVLIIEDLFVRK